MSRYEISIEQDVHNVRYDVVHRGNMVSQSVCSGRADTVNASLMVISEHIIDDVAKIDRPVKLAHFVSDYIGCACLSAPQTPCVYFVKAGEFVKIGYSKDFSNRIGGIQTGCPITLEPLLFFANCEACDERDIHATFRELRTNGEWFKYEGSLRSSVEEFIDRLSITKSEELQLVVN